MRTKCLLTLAASFGMLLLMAGAAQAQICTVQSNYMAGPPATVKPSGIYSVPVKNPMPQYRIVCDYGTIANGVFTPMPGGPAAVATALNPGAGGGPFVWSQANAVNINNPPAGTVVRARLQSWVADQGRWFDEYAAYNPLPLNGGGQ